MNPKLLRYRRHCASASKIIQLQTVVIGVGLLATVYSETAGLSISAGALISVVANMVFFYCLFAAGGAKHIKEIVRGFYLGEALKLILIMVSFGVCFKYLGRLSPPMIVVGFLTAQAMFLLTPLIERFQRPTAGASL